MDYEAEQQSELQLIQTVYPEELEILNDAYPDIKLTVKLPCVPKHENPEPDFYVFLTFSLPEKYPDDPPTIEIDGFPDTIPSASIQNISDKLEEQARSMPGYQVLIMLITEVQYSVPFLIKQLNKEIQQEAERKQQEREEAEQRKFEGNRVTVESFNNWRKEFEKTFLTAEREAQKLKEALLANKLTGRQLFLRDSTLNESDLRLIEKSDADAADIDQIDQSLFEEELSDLDIEDESDG